MKKNDSRNVFLAFLAAILIFLYLDPYFIWGVQKEIPLFSFLAVLLLMLFFSNADVKTKGRSKMFALFAVLLLLSTFYGNLNVFGIIGNLCLAFVPFAKEEFAKKTFNYFLTIYSVVVGISSVVWILSFLGFVHPISNIPPLNELKLYNYNVYPLLVRPNTYYPLERFCGLFDEPGVIGTISVLILTVGKFNLRDKRLLVVFVSGLLTMSFFYYMAVSVYYTIYTFTVSKDKSFGIILIVIIALGVFYTLNNELLYDRLWSRFLWDEDLGSFAGDNRNSDSSRKLFERISGTSTLFFGMGTTDEFIKATRESSSILIAIMHYGLIFVLTYCYLFATYGWRYKNNYITYFLYLFVFVGCLYQRPELFCAEYLFLFSMMAMSCGNLLEGKNTIEKVINKAT